MIYIEKQSEPESLRVHRRTPGADFDGLDKTDTRRSLLEEQGYLCAYCMRRIRKAKDIKIEHYEHRNVRNQLQYENLLAVCLGNQTLKNEKDKVNAERFTCDSMKGEQVLHINPQNKTDMGTIYYDNQGKIYSAIEEYQTDLDEVLNLNDPYGYLIANRKAALKPIIKALSELRQGQDAMIVLRKYERYCNTKNADGEYPEYVGIMRWFIARQIRKHK